MKRILLAGATVLALTAAQPTLAADAPVYKGPAPYATPLYNWSGLYIGISGGYGRATTQWDRNPPPNGPTWSGNGGIFGGTLGWNWQAPSSPWVLGIEGDWSWTNISPGDQVWPGFASCDGAGAICQTRAEWLATLRARAGLASGSLLFYLTGGLAVASLHSFSAPGGSGVINATTTATGWTAGGGLEAALGGNWTLKGEYLYVAFGNFGNLIPSAPGFFTGNNWRAHIVRAGVNLRF